MTSVRGALDSIAAATLIFTGSLGTWIRRAAEMAEEPVARGSRERLAATLTATTTLTPRRRALERAVVCPPVQRERGPHLP